MKKAIATLMCMYMGASGAITGNTQWDIRTGGSNNNGGGFDSTISGAGTDYSQQNSPQFAYTDMVLGTGGTSYTSVAHSPTSLIIGNIVQVISGSGCTAGWYQVTAVAAGVATLDRSAGSATSTCTSNLGGSLLTVAQADSAVVQFNTINIQAGTYTITVGNIVPQPNLTYWGYQTTHGDQGTKPLLTTATNGVSIFSDVAVGATSNAATVFNNIAFSSSAGTPGYGLIATSRVWTGLTVLNCKFSGFAAGLNGDDQLGFYMTWVQIYNSEFTANTIAAIQTQAFVYGSYIHGNTGADGWTVTHAQQTGTYTVFSRTIFSGNKHGINSQAAGSDGPLLVENCTFYNQSSDGIISSGTFTPNEMALVNNVFYSNGGYGLNITSGTATIGPGLNNNNAYGANTSGATSNSVSTGVSAVTLTANPFTSAGTGNFSLNSTAGGGTALKAVGFPGTVAGSISTGNTDIGAIQSTGGGGGGATLHAYPIVQ